jgi:hypothetical protein
VTGGYVSSAGGYSASGNVKHSRTRFLMRYGRWKYSMTYLTQINMEIMYGKGKIICSRTELPLPSVITRLALHGESYSHQIS